MGLKYELVNEQHHSKNKNTNRYVIGCAIFASLNSALLGYDGGVMSGAILFIQKDLKITEVQVEVFVSCLSIVSLVGCLGGGHTADAIGRKWTMGLSCIVFQLGVVLMAIAPSFKVLLAGRILAGIGVGFGGVIALIYIAEISPAASRGTLTSIPEILVNFGILLGYVSNYAFSGLPVHIGWRVMLVVGVLPSVFVAFALFVLPESPRWLVMMNRTKEAQSVLLKITEDETEVEARLSEIEEAAKIQNQEKGVWQELISPSPVVRRMLISGIGIQCFQQITGIDAIVYYSPTIFMDAGLKSEKTILAATIAVGFAKTSFILVAIFLIDRVGRKPLLYVSTMGMTACLFGLGMTLTFLKHGSGQNQIAITLAILAVCGNVAFFSVGIGPICWVVTSEIFPLRLRAQASALGAMGNRVCSGIVSMSFLSASRFISVAGIFLMFSAISAFSVAFVYRFVPETKEKTLEEIKLLFEPGEDWNKGGEVELEDAKHLVQNQ